MNEVRIAQVFQKDTVGRRRLEVEGDIDAGLALDEWKMQIGCRCIKGRSVPVMI